MLPVDYSMCCQTVTVYRKTAGGILRMEIPGCYLQWQEEGDFEKLGWRQERKFLLVQPGERQLVFPGDRVLEGIGPEIDDVAWSTFHPERVPDLGEVSYATAYRWMGKFCHVEAGRR